MPTILEVGIKNVLLKDFDAKDNEFDNKILQAIVNTDSVGIGES